MWRCFFIKPFKTLDEQLLILHNRGLKIGDYDAAKRYLLTNNYYNVINGYSKFFTQKYSDQYLPNASFDEISHLYFFDSEIKSALLDAILIAESHLKYVAAYKFAETNGDEKYSYLNSNNYDQDNILFVGNVISNFSKIIKKNTRSKSRNSIKHYKNKHGDVPIWVIIECLDFGSLYFFVRNLPDSLVNEIAQVMLSFLSDHETINNPLTPKILLSFMDNIRQVRNVCAHGNKLLNFRTNQNIVYYSDIHQPLKITRNSERKSVYDIYVILKCFLSKTQYAILHNTLRKRIKYLDNKLTSISINKILHSLGFPDDWHKNVSPIEH